MICLRILLLLFLLCCHATGLYSATIVNIRVVLQGPYSAGSMITALQRMALLPATDPYGTGVHAATFPENTVDWILLEFRTARTAPATFRQAALLRNDGTVIGVNNTLPAFDETLLPPGAYYVVLRHRNHLPVMTVVPLVLSATTPLYDFTTGNEKVYLQSEAEYGGLIKVQSVWALPAGDVDASGVITALDRDRVKDSSGNLGYLVTDVSLDGVVNAVDRSLTRDNIYRYSSVPDIPPATDRSSSPLRILSVAPVPALAGEQCSAEFSLDRPADVRVELVDMSGRSTLVQERFLDTGCHSLELPHQMLATGMYYLLFTTEEYREMRLLPVIQ